MNMHARAKVAKHRAPPSWLETVGSGGRPLGLKPTQTGLKLMSPSLIGPVVVVREPNVEGLQVTLVR